MRSSSISLLPLPWSSGISVDDRLGRISFKLFVQP